MLATHGLGATKRRGMSTQADRDSSLQFNFVPAGEAGAFAPPWMDGRAEIGPADDLPMFDLLSEGPLPPLPDDASAPAAESKPAPPAPLTPQKKTERDGDGAVSPSGQFWLEGDVIMCACPDCKAPMTVRLWLMIADCWRCGASIELSEEQEREVRRLLERRKTQKQKQKAAAASTAAPTGERKPKTDKPRDNGAAQRPATAAAAATSPKTSPKPSTERPKAEPNRDSQKAATAKGPPPPPPPKAPTSPPPAPRETESPRPAQTEQKRRTRATGAAVGARRRIRRMAKSGVVAVWLSELFRMTPAWLVSAVFHFVLLTLLALYTFPEDDDEQFITLSTDVAANVREGGDIRVDPKDEVVFDLPLPSNLDLENEQVRDAVVRADQDARDLRVDPDAQPNELPPIERIKAQITKQDGPRRSLAIRDPRVRVELVKNEGGTTLTEAAVARGLRWLSMHQNPDGSFSLHAFDRHTKCACGGRGAQTNDSAGTSLALLPFLGAGQTHRTGRYKDAVSKGLRWMVENQRADGYLTARPGDNPQMYAHGQGTIVLCEAFAMEGDEDLRAPAQKAVDFIVKAQHHQGGWRYTPGQEGDTSVVGWQLMALQSAKSAGLNVPDSCLVLAGRFLDLAADPSVGQRVEQIVSAQTQVTSATANSNAAAAARNQQAVIDRLQSLIAADSLDCELSRSALNDLKTAHTRLSRGDKGAATQEAQLSAVNHLRDLKDAVQGSRYAYQPRRPATEVMTAEALLCRMYLGWTKDQQALPLAVNWLSDHHLPSTGRRNMYYWYYATQSMHHVGGEPWNKWNLKMREILVELQETKGHQAGSWSPAGFQHGGAGGRIYVTALATCSLEVYYRHLPIFKQIKLD